MGTPVLDDCWRRVGVRGDHSCPELARHIHCRNCPTYGAAGRRLLDAPVPAHYGEEWAEQLARPAVKPERHSGSAIVFRIGVEWLGMATDLCSRVLPQRPIHSLPHRRGGVVLGVANVEGALVLCVSLAVMLGLAPDGGPRADASDAHATARTTGRSAGNSGRLLVVASPEGRLGIPVQETYGVCRFREEDLHAVPGTLAQGRASHVRAVLPLADRTVGLLATDSLLRSIGGQLA